MIFNNPELNFLSQKVKINQKRNIFVKFILNYLIKAFYYLFQTEKREQIMLHKPKILRNIIILLLMITVANTSYCRRKSSKRATPEKKIHMFMIAMDSGIIERRALSDLKRLTRSKDETIKARAIGLLAQYEGEGSGNLIKALTILIPYVLDKKEASSFKRKLIRGKDDKEFLDAVPVL